ncbi:MAG: TRL domain-containing protein [FCB group bacterium]
MLTLTFLLTSCASLGYGTLITASKTPGNYIVNVPQNNEVKFTKEGTGSVYIIFWLFSFGDASIASAMEDGNIVKLHHIDNHVVSILGLIHIYNTCIW